MTAGGDGCMILADQHGLDARRAELNAKRGLSALNCLLDIVSVHVHLPRLEVITANSVRREAALSSREALYSCLDEKVRFRDCGAEITRSAARREKQARVHAQSLWQARAFGLVS